MSMSSFFPFLTRANSSLHNTFAKGRLSDLELDAEGNIIPRKDPSPSASSTQRVRDYLLTFIIKRDPLPSNLNSTKLFQILDGKLQRQWALQSLAQSKIGTELLSTRSYKRYSFLENQQNQQLYRLACEALAKEIPTSNREWSIEITKLSREYETFKPKDFNVEKIQSLAQAQRNQNSRHHLPARINSRCPHVSYGLKQLSPGDQELFFDLFAKYHYSDNLTNIEELFYQFSSILKKINEYSSTELRNKVKDHIFSKQNWQKRAHLISFKQSEVGEIFPLIEQLERLDSKATVWIDVLLHEIQKQPDKVASFKEAAQTLCHFYAKHKKFPTPNDEVSYLSHLQLIRKNLALYLRLSSLPHNEPFIVLACSNLPLIKKFDRFLSQYKKAFLPNIANKTHAPTTQAEAAFTVKIEPFILQLSQLMPGDLNTTLSLITEFDDPNLNGKLIEVLPKWSHRFRGSSVHLSLVTLFKTHRGAEILSILEEQLKLSVSKLESYYANQNMDWEKFKTKVEQYPSIRHQFHNWLMSLTQVNSESSWTEAINQLPKTTKTILREAADLESVDPSLFESVMKVATLDSTPQTLRILWQIYLETDKNNLMALLSLLEKDPSLIPNLPQVFLLNDSSDELDIFNDSVIRFAQLMYRMDSKILTWVIRSKPTPDLDRISNLCANRSRKLLKWMAIVQNKLMTSLEDPLSERNMDQALEASKHDCVKEALKKGHQIQWSDIPNEIWTKYPHLPLKLQSLLKKLGSNTPMMPLLLEVLEEGPEALIFLLLKLDENQTLNVHLFHLILESPYPKQTASACLNDLTIPFSVTPRLLTAARTPEFSSALGQAEKTLNFQELTSEEERLQRLPLTPYKLLFLTLLRMRETHNSKAVILLKFVKAYPSNEWCTLLLNLINKNEQGGIPEQLFNQLSSLALPKIESNIQMLFPHFVQLLYAHKGSDVLIRRLVALPSDAQYTALWSLYTAFKQNSSHADLITFFLSINLDEWASQIRGKTDQKPLVESFKTKFKSFDERLFNRIMELPKHLPIRPLFDAAIETIEENPQTDVISFLNQVELQNIHPSNLADSTKNTLKSLLKLFCTKYKDADSSLFSHLLSIPNGLDEIQTHLDKDHLLTMIELDRKLAPGKIIAKDFEPGMSQCLTNPKVVEVVKTTSLNWFNLSFYNQWGETYLSLLKANYQHFSMKFLVSNKACMEALQKFVNMSSRFFEHVLTFSTHNNRVKELEQLLKWAVLRDGSVHPKAEGLFDMAQAGYISEAVELVTRSEKDPSNEETRRLLAMADSTTAAYIQAKLRGIEPTDAPKPNFGSITSIENIRNRMTRFLQTQFKHKAEQTCAIQTELSLALAEEMITADERILIPSKGQLDQILEDLKLFLGPEYVDHIRKALSAWENNSNLHEILKKITISSDKNRPAGQIVAFMLRLEKNQPLTSRHAKVAALSAQLSILRQGGVGSCSATSWVCITQKWFEKTLESYGYLLANDGMTVSLYGMHEGTFSLPIEVPIDVMQNPIQEDNLLVKARESILLNTNGYSQINFTTGYGVLTEHLKQFNNDDLFAKEIVKLDLKQKKRPPLHRKLILTELKNIFYSKTKPTYHFTKLHSLYKTAGWWGLSRRDRHEYIVTAQDYRTLLTDVLEEAFKRLNQNHPSHQEYLSTLFQHLKHSIHFNPLNPTFWIKKDGGRPYEIAAADLGFNEKWLRFINFKPQTLEQTVHFLYQFCDALPKVEKAKFEQDPQGLYPLIIPKHSMGLLPATFLQEMTKGRTAHEMIQSLHQQSNIKIEDLDAGTKDSWLNNWVNGFPSSLQANIKKEMQNWEKMTWEELGTMLEKIHKSAYGIGFTQAQREIWETSLFTLLKPEQRMRLPFLVVGDLNWRSEYGDALYLIYARSPIDGQLKAYYTNQKRTSRYSLKLELLNQYWEFIQPVSRKEQGKLRL